MTTVVADRKSISCDLQFTYSGTLKFKGQTKIITVRPDVSKLMFGSDNAFVGFAGNADKWANVVEWFANPTENPPKMKGMEFLALTSKGKIYHASGGLANWMEIKEPCFGIGSGMPYAIAAVTSGKTTAEAVKIASKWDTGTGMGVKTYTFKN